MPVSAASLLQHEFLTNQAWTLTATPVSVTRIIQVTLSNALDYPVGHSGSDPLMFHTFKLVSSFKDLKAMETGPSSMKAHSS